MTLSLEPPTKRAYHSEPRAAATNPTWGEWSLPGHGQAYAKCGWKLWKLCDNTRAARHGGLANVETAHRNCGRAQCPICYQAWAGKEAHRIMRRFEAARIRTTIHVVASPPPGALAPGAALEDVRAMRRAATANLKRCGIRGGCLMFHPARWRCDTCGLDDDACGCSVRKGFWYWSPHFHALGHGWVVGTRENYDKTGWLVKNLGVRQSLHATALYQLSHAGILPNAKPRFMSVTWFGDMSYAKLKVPNEDEPSGCPLCGQEWKIYEWNGQGDPPPDELPLHETTTGLLGFMDRSALTFAGGLIDLGEFLALASRSGLTLSSSWGDGVLGSKTSYVGLQNDGEDMLILGSVGVENSHFVADPLRGLRRAVEGGRGEIAS